jgi:DNA polymerase III epsilon subunit-like protein
MTEKKLGFFIDLETTGLTPPPEGVACILAIGALAEVKVKGEEQPRVVEFYRLVKPTEQQWAMADEKALQVNGLTWDVLQQKGVSLDEAKTEFGRWFAENKIKTSSHQYIGMNPNFDLSFLFTYMAPELEFVDAPIEDPLDLRDLYSVLVNRRKASFLKYRSLKNISMSLGVEPEPEPHDALEGVKALKRSYDRVNELWSS